MRITEVFIAEHPLWDEFRAKMVAYPTISTELDNAVFQGVNRSSIQLLHNYHAGQYMDCEINYFGTVAQRTMNRSALEALLISPEPVKIDFGDGFFYRAVWQKSPRVTNDNEVFESVAYRFRVTKHTEEIKHDMARGQAEIFCQSTVPLTDCRIYVPYGTVGLDTDLYIRLNDMEWSFLDLEITGSLILDGINKLFTMGGVNITNHQNFEWTDFPALKPGSNTLQIVIQGLVIVSVDPPISIRYLPTYL